jgi:hypothetical protein
MLLLLLLLLHLLLLLSLLQLLLLHLRLALCVEAAQHRVATQHEVCLLAHAAEDAGKLGRDVPSLGFRV